MSYIYGSISTPHTLGPNDRCPSLIFLDFLKMTMNSQKFLNFILKKQLTAIMRG